MAEVRWRRATPEEASAWVKNGTAAMGTNGGSVRLVRGIGLMLPVYDDEPEVYGDIPPTSPDYPPTPKNEE